MVNIVRKLFSSQIVKRCLSALALLANLTLVTYKGPVWYMLPTLIIQIICFYEVLNIAYGANKPNNLSNFRPMSWYFLAAANYFFFGEIVADYCWPFVENIYALKFLVKYHRFGSFCMYLIGLIWFLMTLIRKYDRHQFKFLATIHVLLMMIVLQTYMVVGNVFNGMVWMLLSLLLVAANDSGAYLFGKLYGKTPLIEVSPSKTWEGFVGGAVSTMMWGIILSYFFCSFDYLVCPIQYVSTPSGVEMISNCTRAYIFQQWEYPVEIFGNNLFSITTYPLVFHSLIMSGFASVIAPFAGFFASGFKRAFKVKHFGNILPGHGGIIDRFDCQYMMVTFVNVYVQSFFKSPSVDKIYEKFLYLNQDEQLQFFNLLHKSLESRFVLNGNITINDSYK